MAAAMTQRYVRLRGASRIFATCGAIAWAMFLLLSTVGQDKAFWLALTVLLPFAGGAFLLGAMVFGAAASFVLDEQPAVVAFAPPAVDPNWVPRNQRQQADASRPIEWQD